VKRRNEGITRAMRMGAVRAADSDVKELKGSVQLARETKN